MKEFKQVWIRDDGEGFPEFTSDNDSRGVKFVPANKEGREDLCRETFLGNNIREAISEFKAFFKRR